MKHLVSKSSFLRFIASVSGIQVSYFLMYSYFLFGKISWLQLLFSLILFVTYSGFLYFTKKSGFRILFYIFLIFVHVWALVNYAHVKVFNSFFRISLTAVTTYQGGYKDLFFGFYSLMPWTVYVLSILSLICTILYTTSFIRFKRLLIYTIGFDTPSKSLFNRVRYGFIFILFGLILINSLSFFLITHFEKNPRDSWWSMKNQIMDYGFIGSVYRELYKNFKENPDDNHRSENPLLDGKTFLSKKDELNYLYRLEPTSERDRFSDVITRISDRPNILMIQLESISSWAIENIETPMPFLKKLTESNITVDEFYPNSCETINAEFATNCSFIPNSNEPISYSHTGNRYYCLPSILSKNYGYGTYFYHANFSSFWDRDILIPKWGFEKTVFTPDIPQKLYDKTLFEKVVEELKKETKPFYAYITTFTTHAPHNEELMEYYNKRNGNIIESFSGSLSPYTQKLELNESFVRNYFGFLRATDNALKTLFLKLEESGLSENTIVFIYNDHRFYNFDADMEDYFRRYNKNPFVVVLPKKSQGSVTRYASHVDIAPTILHMIDKNQNAGDRFGLLGTSIFSDNHKDQILNTCLGNVFFLNENVLVEGNVRSGVYRAEKRNTEVPDEYIIRMKSLTRSMIGLIDTVLSRDELVP